AKWAMLPATAPGIGLWRRWPRTTSPLLVTSTVEPSGAGVMWSVPRSTGRRLSEGVTRQRIGALQLQQRAGSSGGVMEGAASAAAAWVEAAGGEEGARCPRTGAPLAEVRAAPGQRLRCT